MGFWKADNDEALSYKLLLQPTQQQLSAKGNIWTCRGADLEVVLALQREGSARGGGETLTVPMLLLSSCSLPGTKAFCVRLRF